eukprot:5714608-Pyramimonas_sp.AAC.1
MRAQGDLGAEILRRGKPISRQADVPHELITDTTLRGLRGASVWEMRIGHDLPGDATSIPDLRPPVGAGFCCHLVPVECPR